MKNEEARGKERREFNNTDEFEFHEFDMRCRKRG
jgi:hypothetical protein